MPTSPSFLVSSVFLSVDSPVNYENCSLLVFEQVLLILPTDTIERKIEICLSCCHTLPGTHFLLVASGASSYTQERFVQSSVFEFM